MFVHGLSANGMNCPRVEQRLCCCVSAYSGLSQCKVTSDADMYRALVMCIFIPQLEAVSPFLQPRVQHVRPVGSTEVHCHHTEDVVAQ